jgi:hypothetical protein
MRYISPGQCLSCGSICDLERMQKVANQSLGCLKRVQEEICLTSCTGNEKQRLLDEALQSLQSLRSVLHAFNKDIAKAEDVIAEMFCLTLQPQSAIHHCKESIQILEKEYHTAQLITQQVKFYSQHHQSSQRSVYQLTMDCQSLQRIWNLVAGNVIHCLI